MDARSLCFVAAFTALLLLLTAINNFFFLVVIDAQLFIYFIKLKKKYYQIANLTIFFCLNILIPRDMSLCKLKFEQ